jgi:hypothetical protein
MLLPSLHLCSTSLLPQRRAAALDHKALPCGSIGSEFVYALLLQLLMHHRRQQQQQQQQQELV